MKSIYVDKWIACSLLITITFSPIEFLLFKDIEAKATIRLCQLTILVGVMHLRHRNVLNQYETIMFLHMILLCSHSIYFATQTKIETIKFIELTMINVLHSLLSTMNIQLDLIFACILPISVYIFSNIELFMVVFSVFPSFVFICWNAINTNSVRFKDIAEKSKDYKRVRRCAEYCALSMTLLLLVPTAGINGLKSFLIVSFAILMEHNLLVPFISSIYTIDIAKEISFVFSVSTALMIHVMAVDFVDISYYLFETIKIIPSVVLAIHNPHFIGILFYFVNSYINGFIIVKQHNLNIDNFHIFAVSCMHFMLFFAMKSMLIIYELKEKNEKLLNDNANLAVHCNLPTVDNQTVPDVDDNIELFDNDTLYPSDNSGHSGNLYTEENIINTEKKKLERLMHKIQKLTTKLYELSEGDEVSSESTMSTMNSHDKLHYMKLELEGVKHKMVQIMEVMNNNEFGAVESVLELQRQFGMKQTIAIGIACPTSHTGEADVSL